MRYTARTRSIRWKKTPMVEAAVAFLEQLLNSDSPYIFRGRLEPGMGLICNNVLHDRTGFSDDGQRHRLLYRARYYDRIAGTELASVYR
jgi:alpha-ketoglutarate-dependent taurine dioxygenase